MKQSFTLLIFCLITLPCFSQAGFFQQSGKPVKNAISFHPLDMLGNTFKISYERKVSSQHSLKCITSFSSSEYSYIYNVNNFSQYGLELQFRRYLKAGDNLNGTYLAPFSVFKQYKAEVDIFSGNFGRMTPIDGRALGFGLLIGHQVLNKAGMNLDAYFGGGMLLSTSDKNDAGISYLHSYERGTMFHAGFSLGFAF